MSKIAAAAHAAISALNGVFGDYLVQRNNGLAISMGFIHADEALSLDAASLRAAFPAAGKRVAVLVHGLCCSEVNWNFEKGSYGSLLQRDLGITPFYLRYNSGLPIAENGRALADLMLELDREYPGGLEEINLIGHSMGGLVIRQACEYATAHKQGWVNKVARGFYLGTPHDGADLAKFAHLAAATLKVIPNPVTNVIGEVLDLRSGGIKDLRRGVPRAKVAWLPHAEHYLIAGTLAESPEHIVSVLFGDILVKVPGESASLLPPENIRIFPKLHHMALAHDGQVYEQIKCWCQSSPGESR